MELVKLTKEEIQKEIKLKSEKDILKATEMYLDVIKSCQNTFKENNIPITINLRLQENHPKVEIFREIYHKSEYNTYSNQDIPK
jgi:hypothetical protein